MNDPQRELVTVHVDQVDLSRLKKVCEDLETIVGRQVDLSSFQMYQGLRWDGRGEDTPLTFRRRLHNYVFSTLIRLTRKVLAWAEQSTK